MPTQHERLFHGIGAGDDLGVVSAGSARVGGLICRENRMPLARYAVYREGPQIWVAPTADDSDGWLASMRHIAIESGAFVVSVPQFIPAAAFPSDFPVRFQRARRYLGPAGWRSSSRSQARSSPDRYTARRQCWLPTAICDAACMPSGASTPWHYGREDVLRRHQPGAQPKSPFGEGESIHMREP